MHPKIKEVCEGFQESNSRGYLSTEAMISIVQSCKDFDRVVQKSIEMEGRETTYLKMWINLWHFCTNLLLRFNRFTGKLHK